MNIIRQKAVKPILEITMTPFPFHICVTFTDGTRYQERDAGAFRMFLITLQNITFERIEGDVSHCTPSKICSYYKLLGVHPGDAFKCYNSKGETFSILFS